MFGVTRMFMLNDPVYSLITQMPNMSAYMRTIIKWYILNQKSVHLKDNYDKKKAKGKLATYLQKDVDETLDLIMATRKKSKKKKLSKSALLRAMIYAYRNYDSEIIVHSSETGLLVQPTGE